MSASWLRTHCADGPFRGRQHRGEKRDAKLDSEDQRRRGEHKLTLADWLVSMMDGDTAIARAVLKRVMKLISTRCGKAGHLPPHPGTGRNGLFDLSFPTSAPTNPTSRSAALSYDDAFEAASAPTGTAVLHDGTQITTPEPMSMTSTRHVSHLLINVERERGGRTATCQVGTFHYGVFSKRVGHDDQ